MLATSMLCVAIHEALTNQGKRKWIYTFDQIGNPDVEVWQSFSVTSFERKAFEVGQKYEVEIRTEA